MINRFFLPKQGKSNPYQEAQCLFHFVKNDNSQLAPRKLHLHLKAQYQGEEHTSDNIFRSKSKWSQIQTKAFWMETPKHFAMRHSRYIMSWLK